jgi:hypothetical protein
MNVEGNSRGLIYGNLSSFVCQELRETAKILDQNNQFAGQDLDLELPEREAGMQTLLCDVRRLLPMICLRFNR